MQRLLLKVILVFLILFSSPLYGKRFKSSYVTFKVSYDWICKSFGVDWVCHHRLNKGDKPTFMLITAKEGSNSDQVNDYIKIFNEEQAAGLKKIHVKTILVNRHVWVDNFVKNSISDKMFSRYTATVCCNRTKAKIHVLIGFHAHKKSYTKYAREFLRSIKSLQLTENTEEALKKIKKQTDQQRRDMLSYIEKILMEIDSDENTKRERNKINFDLLFNVLFFGIILIFMAVLIYSLKRKNKSNTRNMSGYQKKKRIK